MGPLERIEALAKTLCSVSVFLIRTYKAQNIAVVDRYIADILFNLLTLARRLSWIFTSAKRTFRGFIDKIEFKRWCAAGRTRDPSQADEVLWRPDFTRPLLLLPHDANRI